MMISEDAIASNNMAAKMLNEKSECERSDLKAEKLERLRDEFAMATMKGICAHPDTWGITTPDIAKEAYLMADAMLKAREQSK